MDYNTFLYDYTRAEQPQSKSEYVGLRYKMPIRGLYAKGTENGVSILNLGILSS